MTFSYILIHCVESWLMYDPLYKWCIYVCLFILKKYITLRYISSQKRMTKSPTIVNLTFGHVLKKLVIWAWVWVTKRHITMAIQRLAMILFLWLYCKKEKISKSKDKGLFYTRLLDYVKPRTKSCPILRARRFSWGKIVNSYWDTCTVGQNNQKYRLMYWATRPSVRSFPRTTHSFACSALLASLAGSAVLTRLLARSLRSLLSSWNSELLMSQNDLILPHKNMVDWVPSRDHCKIHVG